MKNYFIKLKTAFWFAFEFFITYSVLTFFYLGLTLFQGLLVVSVIEILIYRFFLSSVQAAYKDYVLLLNSLTIAMHGYFLRYDDRHLHYREAKIMFIEFFVPKLLLVPGRLPLLLLLHYCNGYFYFMLKGTFLHLPYEFSVVELHAYGYPTCRRLWRTKWYPWLVDKFPSWGYFTTFLIWLPHRFFDSGDRLGWAAVTRLHDAASRWRYTNATQKVTASAPECDLDWLRHHVVNDLLRKQVSTRYQKIKRRKKTSSIFLPVRRKVKMFQRVVRTVRKKRYVWIPATRFIKRWNPNTVEHVQHRRKARFFPYLLEQNYEQQLQRQRRFSIKQKLMELETAQTLRDKIKFQLSSADYVSSEFFVDPEVNLLFPEVPPTDSLEELPLHSEEWLVLESPFYNIEIEPFQEPVLDHFDSHQDDESDEETDLTTVEDLTFGTSEAGPDFEKMGAPGPTLSKSKRTQFPRPWIEMYGHKKKFVEEEAPLLEEFAMNNRDVFHFVPKRSTPNWDNFQVVEPGDGPNTPDVLPKWNYFVPRWRQTQADWFFLSNRTHKLSELHFYANTYSHYLLNTVRTFPRFSADYDKQFRKKRGLLRLLKKRYKWKERNALREERKDAGFWIFPPFISTFSNGYSHKRFRNVEVAAKKQRHSWFQTVRFFPQPQTVKGWSAYFVNQHYQHLLNEEIITEDMFSPQAFRRSRTKLEGYQLFGISTTLSGTVHKNFFWGLLDRYRRRTLSWHAPKYQPAYSSNRLAYEELSSFTSPKDNWWSTRPEPAPGFFLVAIVCLCWVLLPIMYGIQYERITFRWLIPFFEQVYADNPWNPGKPYTWVDQRGEWMTRVEQGLPSWDYILRQRAQTRSYWRGNWSGIDSTLVQFSFFADYLYNRCGITLSFYHEPFEEFYHLLTHMALREHGLLKEFFAFRGMTIPPFHSGWCWWYGNLTGEWNYRGVDDRLTHPDWELPIEPTRTRPEPWRKVHLNYLRSVMGWYFWRELDTNLSTWQQRSPYMMEWFVGRMREANWATILNNPVWDDPRSFFGSQANDPRGRIRSNLVPSFLRLWEGIFVHQNLTPSRLEPTEIYQLRGLVDYQTAYPRRMKSVSPGFVLDHTPQPWELYHNTKIVAEWKIAALQLAEPVREDQSFLSFCRGVSQAVKLYFPVDELLWIARPWFLFVCPWFFIFRFRSWHFFSLSTLLGVPVVSAHPVTRAGTPNKVQSDPVLDSLGEGDKTAYPRFSTLARDLDTYALEVERRQMLGEVLKPTAKSIEISPLFTKSYRDASYVVATDYFRLPKRFRYQSREFYEDDVFWPSIQFGWRLTHRNYFPNQLVRRRRTPYPIGYYSSYTGERRAYRGVYRVRNRHHFRRARLPFRFRPLIVQKNELKKKWGNHKKKRIPVVLSGVWSKKLRNPVQRGVIWNKLVTFPFTYKKVAPQPPVTVSQPSAAAYNFFVANEWKTHPQVCQPSIRPAKLVSPSYNRLQTSNWLARPYITRGNVQQDLHELPYRPRRWTELQSLFRREGPELRTGVGYHLQVPHWYVRNERSHEFYERAQLKDIPKGVSPVVWRTGSIAQLKQTQHLWHLKRYRSTVQVAGTFWSNPGLPFSSLYTAFLREAALVNYPGRTTLFSDEWHRNKSVDTGYDVEVFDEDVVESPLAGEVHPDEQEDIEDFDNITQEDDQVGYLSLEASKLVTVVSTPTSCNWVGRRLVSYKRFGSLPLGAYQVSAPTTYLFWGGWPASAIRWSTAAVDHPAYRHLVGYATPRIFRRLTRWSQITTEYTRRSNPSLQAEKDLFRTELDQKYRVDLPHRVWAHPQRTLHARRSGLEDLVEYDWLSSRRAALQAKSVCSTGWAVRKVNLTDWISEAYDPALGGITRTTFQEHALDELNRNGWGVYNLSTAVDSDWAHSDFDTLEFGSLSGLNLGYRGTKITDYVSAQFRPFDSVNMVKPVWSPVVGLPTTGYLIAEDLDEKTLPDVEVLWLDILASRRREPYTFIHWYGEYYLRKNDVSKDDEHPIETADPDEELWEGQKDDFPYWLVAAVFAGVAQGNRTGKARQARLSGANLAQALWYLPGYSRAQSILECNDRYNIRTVNEEQQFKDYNLYLTSLAKIVPKRIARRWPRILPPEMNYQGYVDSIPFSELDLYRSTLDRDAHLKLWALTELYYNEGCFGRRLDH